MIETDHVAADFGTALSHYRAGRLGPAETACRALLAREPAHRDAVNLLAVLCCRAGRLADGAALARRALAIAPDDLQALELLGDALDALKDHAGAADAFLHAAAQKGCRRFHLKAGASLHHAGRFEEAVEQYRAVLASGEATATDITEYGLVLTALARTETAVAAFQAALKVAPREARTWAYLAEQLALLGRTDEAISAWDVVLALRPGDAGAHYDRARQLHLAGRDEAALGGVDRALLLDPAAERAHGLRSAVLWQLGRFEEAAEAASRALALAPGSPTALTNLGNALKDLGRLDEALTAQQRALSRSATAEQRTTVLVNLGLAHQARGEAAAALAALEQAATLSPDQPWPQFNLALARLRGGDLDLGWLGYGWRWRGSGLAKRLAALGRPVWDGRPLDGRLMLVAEQGVGDEIMFAGLVPALFAAGLDVVIECDRRLAPLFARSFPGVTTVARDELPEAPEGVAAACPIGDLPGLLRPDGRPGPWLAPGHLAADRGHRDALRRRYHDGRPLVGLAWRTSNVRSGRQRSIALDRLWSLIDLPVRLVCLQYGDADALAAEAAAAGVDLVVDREIDQRRDLDAFAAQVAAMDAVLTIDNSTAHLAAALGRPTVVMLPVDADWRWFAGRSDSPWYPTVRLIRQPHPDDWDAVIAQAIEMLTSLPGLAGPAEKPEHVSHAVP
ncbi:tetratricopeptide repeat-containing glycosyltransferase family protein [Rhodoplanes sp. TEM]|uniref:Tetratricopeptide repeat-containing glycosyltransferase family protein n=1 Tax=Rhodoplanes tepidamans TaxID=200616 RepID=A0ABT5JEK3_RHOTP|nr:MULTISPECIES: tetratricopeptide repeat-containing glycosyltransferase family protein [Rhodoplanes]MDC7788116.1 tetratricopeptide repeat-containing glycosyltransferase family protein [Rhodoplanes tepidamans]MDC7984598.1 tetratricopeptide repeat-containing glycosyltransferase family protein [Rhodoplanes sp. TEM]MDQ0355593.1 tetratricopeptide (TPR) repeat protein [Rhodoplanes tepidamans]